MSRVSLFIDGENTSADKAPDILSAARRLGSVDWVRVYGDVGRLAGWEAVPEVRPIHSGIGKNAADLLLTVDAMERALSGLCDTVVIASSDGDFRHLAQRLRERGLTVLGIGREAAGMRFKASCSSFKVLRGTPSNPQRIPTSEVKSADQGASLPQNRWQAAIIALLRERATSAGITTQELGQRMGERHGVHIRMHPDGNWKTFLDKRHGAFCCDASPGGTLVRLRHPHKHPDPIAIAAE